MKPLQQAIALLQVARDLIEAEARQIDRDEEHIELLEDASDAISVALVNIESIEKPPALTDDEYERAAEDAQRKADAKEGFDE